MTRRGEARSTALLLASVTAAYLTSLWGSFQFDDFNVIVDNDVVHSLAAWWADVGHGIRPLLKLSYAVNWSIDPRALGFHVVNLALHLGNTALVLALGRRIVAGYEPVARHAPAAALLAAALFGLHPAQTEAVTYVSGRSASLETAFYLAAVLAYVQGVLEDRRWLHAGLSPLLFILALASKESAISLPLLLGVWEASRAGQPRSDGAARRLAVPAAVMLAAALLLLWHPVYGHRVIPELEPDGLRRNALSQVAALSYLVRRLVVVHPLDIEPDLRMVDSLTASGALQAAALLAVLAAAIAALRRRPWLGFGLLWFFVVLLPTNSLLPRLDLANDRQLYLASVGVFLALAVEVERLRDRVGSAAGRWLRGALAAALIACAALTALRNLDYRSEVALWEQTASASPRKPRVFNNLAVAYSAAGCTQQAEAAYREALRLDPGYALARDNLASLLESAASQPEASCSAGR